MVVAEVVLVVEAVLTVVVALSVVDQVVRPPKVATPRMVRTSRAIEKMTTEIVGTTHFRDNPVSTTIELTHLIAGKLPSTRSTTTCAPIMSAANSTELTNALKTLRHANSVRRQCLRRPLGRQGSNFFRMFDLGKRSLSVASLSYRSTSTLLSHRQNSRSALPQLR